MPTSFARRWLPLLPYAAVVIGMYVVGRGLSAALIYYAGIALWMSTRPRPFPVSRLWRGGGGGELALALTLGGAAGLGTYLLWPFLNLEPVLVPALQRLSLTGFDWVAFLILFSTVNAPLEEWFWRGALAGERRGPELNDALFAGFHGLVLWMLVGWAEIAVSLLFLWAAAWAWRRLANWKGGLRLPLAMHWAADASLTLAVAIRLGGGPEI